MPSGSAAQATLRRCFHDLSGFSNVVIEAVLFDPLDGFSERQSDTSKLTARVWLFPSGVLSAYMTAQACRLFAPFKFAEVATLVLRFADASLGLAWLRPAGLSRGLLGNRRHPSVSVSRV